ncbi:MAG TPA: hypothetical protein V6D06_05515 [Trichocoleus sp.]
MRGRGCRATAQLKLLIYLSAITLHLNFAYIVADYLLSMLVVCWQQLRGWRLARLSPKLPGSRWIAAGVGTSVLAAALLPLPWAALGRLQPVDIYHLVQMVALACFHQGVWRNATASASQTSAELRQG